MLPNQTIDFTREDSGGLWLLFVMGAVFGLTLLRKGDFRGGGWRKPVRKIALSILFGVVLMSPIVLFVAIWERWPPQYFITLRVGEKQVNLGQRWPDSDLVIPFSDIISVSKIHESKRFRRDSACNRIVIQTSKETYRSFGYGRSTEAEQKIWEQLVALVEEKQRSHSPRPDDTNNPPAKVHP